MGFVFYGFSQAFLKKICSLYKHRYAILQSVMVLRLITVKRDVKLGLEDFGLLLLNNLLHSLTPCTRDRQQTLFMDMASSFPRVVILSHSGGCVPTGAIQFQPQKHHIAIKNPS